MIFTDNVKFSVTGMSCAACQAHVENAVKKVNGVKSVSVNLLTNSMLVSYDAPANIDIICSAVKMAGYEAKLSESIMSKTKNDIVKSQNNLAISIIVLLVLMYFSFGVSMLGLPCFKFILNNPIIICIIEAVLSLIIILINRKFYINGFKGAIHLAPNMDTLIAMGSGISYVYSLVLVIIKGSASLNSLYFESAAMILVLISVGKLLEQISKGKTTNAISDLINLVPDTITVIVDGEEKLVSIDTINVGDIFVLKPGDRVPVDGIVKTGFGAIDESTFTGESIPVDKVEGSTVSAGTININGVIKCEATKVGKDTSLSKMIKTLEDATASKAPIAKMADKVASVFVPVVLLIALITFIVWTIIGKEFSYSITKAISVLVISCPCSLGLATPVAIMVGCGVGAKNGILYKTAEALEVSGKIDTIVFDKTGTLTKGEMSIIDAISYDESFFKYAYSLEKNSNHPIAKAITQYVNINESFDVSNFENLIGNGICGTIENRNVYAGNLQFTKEKIEVSLDIEESILDFYKNGKIVVLFATDEKLLGYFVISDTLKDDAKETITKLSSMNISCVMLTGDNRYVATSIAKEANISNVVYEVLPEEKSSKINELRQSGRVAMVGDGINDALALTYADVGIALGTGTDVAINSGDIVLASSKMESVYKLVSLSKKVLRNIKENLFWAFFYNIICIPIAAGVFSFIDIELTPMMGAAAMSLSSIFVVLNALRINLFNYKKKDKEGKVMTKRLTIDGMMCIHCQTHVEEALAKVDGVKSVVVSLEDQLAEVSLSWDVPDSVLSKAVSDAGYKVVKIS